MDLGGAEKGQNHNEAEELHCWAGSKAMRSGDNLVLVLISKAKDVR